MKIHWDNNFQATSIPCDPMFFTLCQTPNCDSPLWGQGILSCPKRVPPLSAILQQPAALADPLARLPLCEQLCDRVFRRGPGPCQAGWPHRRSWCIKFQGRQSEASKQDLTGSSHNPQAIYWPSAMCTIICVHRPMTEAEQTAGSK